MICRKRSRVPTKTRTLDKAVRHPWDSGKELFPSRWKKKASEPDGSEAVIPIISLVALPCGGAETASGGTWQHQNASSEASSRYSRSVASILTSRHSSCTQLSAPFLTYKTPPLALASDRTAAPGARPSQSRARAWRQSPAGRRFGTACGCSPRISGSFPWAKPP